MKSFITFLLNFFTKALNLIVTQDFKLKGYKFYANIGKTKFQIFYKKFRPILCYRGETWEKNRNEFMIEKHGLTYEQTKSREYSHLFVVKCNYSFS